MDNWRRKGARSRRNVSHAAVAAAGAAGARGSFTPRCGEAWIRRERKHQVGA